VKERQEESRRRNDREGKMKKEKTGRREREINSSI